jgi:hypothetical protein
MMSMIDNEAVMPDSDSPLTEDQEHILNALKKRDGQTISELEVSARMGAQAVARAVDELTKLKRIDSRPEGKSLRFWLPMDEI